MVLNIFSKISIFNHLPLDIIVGTLGMIIDFMDNISRHHPCQRRSPPKVVLVIDISISRGAGGDIGQRNQSPPEVGAGVVAGVVVR